MKKVNPITARVKAKFAQLTKPTKEFSIGNINQSTEPAIAPSGHIGMVPQKAIPSMAKQTKSKAATESKAKVPVKGTEPAEGGKKPIKGIEPVKGKEPVKEKEIPKFTGKTQAELQAYLKKHKTEENAEKMNDLYEKELTSINQTRALKSKPVRSRTTSKGSGSGYSSRSTPKAKAKAKSKAKGKVKTKKEKAAAKDEEKASMAKNYKSGYYGVGKSKKKKKK